MTQRFIGRSVIVTGAASGIGSAAAGLFAAEGAAVTLADLNAEGLQETARSIQEAGGRTLVHPCDVSRSGDCAALVRSAADWAGGLHVLANVAGMGQFDGTVETLDEEQWDRVLSVNLKSVYLVSKYAIPHLRMAGGGVILNVASPHAFATTAGVCAYAASKGGVVALSRQMAIDFAPDRIRVVPVVPGAVDTPMLRSHAERQNTTLEALGFHTDPGVMGRIGSSEEMARVLLWLASDEATFVTASPIVADGGLLARL